MKREIVSRCYLYSAGPVVLPSGATAQGPQVPRGPVMVMQLVMILVKAQQSGFQCFNG